MKKLISVIMGMLLLISLCSCANESEIEKNFKNNSGKSKNIYDGYSEDEPLFLCNDRCDVEYDDGRRVYAYNYKGKLLENSNYIGYRAKNGLALAEDPATKLFGFINKDGEFVIKPKYIYGAPFSDSGLAVVCIENEENKLLWGVIDTKGNTVVDFIYPNINSYLESGYAVFETKNQNGVDEYGNPIFESFYGILNTKGKIVAEPIYSAIYYVYDGYFVAEKGESDTDFDALKIFSFEGKVLEDKLSNGDKLWELYCSISNKNTLEDDRDDKTAKEFLSKVAGTERYSCECNKNGIIRYHQTIDTNINSENYAEILESSDGAAETFNGKKFVAYKNKATHKISSKNVATTKSGVAYGVTDHDKTVIPFEYDSIWEINDYFVGVKLKDDDYNNRTIDIYNSKFECTAKDLEFGIYIFNAQNPLPSGYFEVIKYDSAHDEEIYGIIDENGKIIVDISYRDSRILACTYEGTAHFS